MVKDNTQFPWAAHTLPNHVMNPNCQSVICESDLPAIPTEYKWREQGSHTQTEDDNRDTYRQQPIV